ncbi:MAG: cell division protein FtsL [Granulosicoccus sp.]
MSSASLTSLCLAALCFCTAIAVVYSKHLSRQAYAELSTHQKLIDELDVQWSQLQIEESTFSEHGRIESVARDELGMSFPELDGSIMIVR